MKKLLLMLVVAVASVGCSKDDSSLLKINRTEVNLKYDEDFHFSIENASSVEWSSSDEFVGTIGSDGKFDAKHIGETTITGKTESHSVTAKVIVDPYITDITEPYTYFGSNKQSVKEYEKRSISAENTGLIIYNGRGDKENEVLYLFENSRLTSSVLSFKTYGNLADDLAKFYGERYTYLGSGDDVLIFESKNKTYGLGISVSSAFGLHAMYIPSPSSNAASIKSSIKSQNIKAIPSVEIKNIEKNILK